jgi:hypothetical protein
MRIGKLLTPDTKLDVAKLVDQNALPASMRVSLPATL